MGYHGGRAGEAEEGLMLWCYLGLHRWGPWSRVVEGVKKVTCATTGEQKVYDCHVQSRLCQECNIQQIRQAG